MQSNPAPCICLDAEWFLQKGLIGFYNDILTLQVSCKKKELLLLLMKVLGEKARTEESLCSSGGPQLDSISTECEQRMLSQIVSLAIYVLKVIQIAIFCRRSPLALCSLKYSIYRTGSAFSFHLYLYSLFVIILKSEYILVHIDIQLR